jgi:hypothetical protein
MAEKSCLFNKMQLYFQSFGTDFPYGILSASFQTSGIKSSTPRHPYSFSFFRNYDLHPNLQKKIPTKYAIPLWRLQVDMDKRMPM